MVHSGIVKYTQPRVLDNCKVLHGRRICAKFVNLCIGNCPGLLQGTIMTIQNEGKVQTRITGLDKGKYL